MKDSLSSMVNAPNCVLRACCNKRYLKKNLFSMPYLSLMDSKGSKVFSSKI